MENHQLKLLAAGAQDGEFVSVVGDTYRLAVTGEQTDGAFAVIDMLVPPGGGPGPHSHAAIQESFYVLDGEIEVKSESGTTLAAKGGFVSIAPGGLVHQFKNKTDKVAHLLCIVTPAGMDQFFREIGLPIAAGNFLPAPEMTAEYLQKVEALAAKYGQKLFPPDFLD